VTCAVVASNASGSSATATSLPVVILPAPLAGVPVDLTPPLVTGTPQVGQLLSCSQGTWTNTPTGYAYSWQRDAVAIAGATSSSYTPVAGDATHQVTCAVVASNASGSSATATSLPVVILPAPLAGGSGSTTSGSGGGSAPANGSILPQATSQLTAGQSGGAGTAPTVAGFRLAARRFAVAASPTALVATSKAGGRPPKGTQFRFSLSQPGWVAIKIQRRTSGVERHGHCLQASSRPAARVGKRCGLLLLAGTLIRAEARSGSAVIAFSGRLGSKALTPGTYSATIAAVSPVRLWSQPQSATFTVVKASPRPPRS
jgi:hypothetical protein